MMYRINVKTLNNNILSFKNVESYQVVDGFLTFTDSKTKQIKRFSHNNCEIEEEREWERFQKLSKRIIFITI